MAASIEIGASPEGIQSMALKRANRHGLSAGATGTGKTVTLQVLGAMGISADTVVERIYRDIRAFRLYDGPSEVHRWVLARD